MDADRHERCIWKAQFMDDLSPMLTHSTNKQEHYQQVGNPSLRFTDERGTKYTEVHWGPRYTGWRGTEDSRWWVSDSQMREGPNTPKCTEDPGTLDGEGLRTAGNESELREGPKVMSLLRGTKYTEVHQGPRYTERDWGVRTCHWQFATRTGPVLLLSAIRRSTPRISRRVFSSTFNWRRQRTQGAVALRVSLKHSPW